MHPGHDRPRQQETFGSPEPPGRKHPLHSTYIQDGLASSDFTDLEGLCDWADEIMSRQCCQTLSACNVSEQPLEDDTLDSPAVQHLYCRDNNFRPPLMARHSPPSQLMCCIHKCFSQAARQCWSPCVWAAGKAHPAPQQH